MAHAVGASSTQHTDTVKTIVIVDDDHDIRRYITQALHLETSYHVLCANNPYDAYRVVSGLIPSLFILDYQLSLSSMASTCMIASMPSPDWHKFLRSSSARTCPD